MRHEWTKLRVQEVAGCIRGRYRSSMVASMSRTETKIRPKLSSPIEEEEERLYLCLHSSLGWSLS